ncbi:MAG: STAS domain-containing protein [Leptospirales bacterium]|nr:STAS domain-containing protein [Leptospirales bacterium]
MLLLKLAGKFDIEQSDYFEKTFNQLAAGKPKRVCLDMTDVNFIDSSGIGAMIKALNLVKSGGGEMILFGLKPMILSVFKLAKLDNFFKVLSPEEFRLKYGG